MSDSDKLNVILVVLAACYKAGEFKSEPGDPGYGWFSVLPNDSFHPPGVPGLNQSLTSKDTFKSAVELALGSSIELVCYA